jgi:hypothetical protein
MTEVVTVALQVLMHHIHISPDVVVLLRVYIAVPVLVAVLLVVTQETHITFQAESVVLILPHIIIPEHMGLNQRVVIRVVRTLEIVELHFKNIKI